MDAPIRVFVVEDSPLIRRRIIDNVQALGSFDVVGFAEAEAEAVDAIAARLTGYHRLSAVRAHLLERAGDSARAAEFFASAARRATSIAERDHLLRRAARARLANRKDG